MAIENLPRIEEIEIEMFLDKLIFNSFYLPQKNDLIPQLLCDRIIPLVEMREDADCVVLA